MLLAIVTVVILVVGVLPQFARKGRGTSKQIRCVSNLKQISLGFRLYAGDHNDAYPAFNETNAAWQYFQAAGHEMGSPYILRCPVDAQRDLKSKPARDFEDPPQANSFAHPAFRNAAMSYFHCADADRNDPEMLLAGDRNITTDGKMRSGLLTLTANSPAMWTKDLHKNKGTVALADGSVQQVAIPGLQEQLKKPTNGVQRLVLP